MNNYRIRHNLIFDSHWLELYPKSRLFGKQKIILKNPLKEKHLTFFLAEFHLSNYAEGQISMRLYVLGFGVNLHIWIDKIWLVYGKADK